MSMDIQLKARQQLRANKHKCEKLIEQLQSQLYLCDYANLHTTALLLVDCTHAINDAHYVVNAKVR